jgi:hypothetical protein
MMDGTILEAVALEPVIKKKSKQKKGGGGEKAQLFG